MNDACYYRISIKGLVVDETGRFLLVKEDNGKWELPGGGLDHGEDPINGLRREIHEEMGLVVTAISPSPKYFVTTRRRGSDTFIANVIYEIELQDLNFTASDECQELRYFTVDEARKEDLFPNVAKLLEVYDPQLYIGNGMWHGWHLFASYAPEAKRAMGEVARYVIAHTQPKA